MSGMYEPSICLLAQGAKRVLLGDDTFVYDARHFLLTSVHLPTVVQITDASREKPCPGFMLKLDQRVMSQLMVDSNLHPPRVQQSSRGMATAAFQVGYESPSQFSREYSRLFGAPPLRDITNLRQMATQ